MTAEAGPVACPAADQAEGADSDPAVVAVAVVAVVDVDYVVDDAVGVDAVDVEGSVVAMYAAGVVARGCRTELGCTFQGEAATGSRPLPPAEKTTLRPRCYSFSHTSTRIDSPSGCSVPSTYHDIYLHTMTPVNNFPSFNQTRIQEGS